MMHRVAPLYVAIGIFLLVWALFAYRRSRFDALLLGLAGAILLFGEVTRLLPDHLRVQSQAALWATAALGVIGLLLLIRLFISRLSIPERVGMGATGCLLMIPALLILGYLSLLGLGSASRARAPAQPANSASPVNSAAAATDPAPANEQGEQPR